MLIVLQTIKKDRVAQAVLGAFVFFTLWWLFLTLYPGYGERLHDVFAATYGVVALIGGISGLVVAARWGGFKSTVGRALTFFSLGLLLQEWGQITYSYFISYAHIDVPYPSIGDIGYFGSIPLYILGVIFLAKSMGIELTLGSFANKLKALLIPATILIVSYFAFLQGYTADLTKPLNIFLDFGYPFGQAIYISIALVTYLLCRERLGGVMKNRILFVLIALFFQFLADYVFLYQASNQTWSISGINDYMYLWAYFLMAMALRQLNTTWGNLKMAGVNGTNVKVKTETAEVAGKYLKAVVAIINGQKQVLGPVAEDLAKSVDGLAFNDLEHLQITGDPKAVLTSLMDQYEQLFGETSIEVSKKALLKNGLVDIL